MMNELLTLNVPLRNDIMTTIRLATGGVCSLAGLSFDDSEDCKVCVTESLLLLKHRGYASARVSFSAADELEIAVEGGESSEGEERTEDDEISVALLCALVENVIMDRRDGRLYRVAFRFGKRA